MSSQNQKQITKTYDIYRSRKHILEYLKQQNYNTDAFEQMTMTEINAMTQDTIVDEKSQLDFVVVKKDDEQMKCSVNYYLKQVQSIKKNVLEDMVMNYYQDNDKTKCVFILIIQGNINDTIQKTIKHLWKKHVEYVIVYELKTLLFNILEHSYVPKHEKLTNEEKIQLYKTKNITHDSQVPEISMFDPMAKALLLKPGEVCKITRYNKISYIDYFYRLCVI